LCPRAEPFTSEPSTVGQQIALFAITYGDDRDSLTPFGIVAPNDGHVGETFDISEEFLEILGPNLFATTIDDVGQSTLNLKMSINKRGPVTGGEPAFTALG